MLVDERDRPLGWAEKLAAHRDGGRLHRAFSIFLFDTQGRMLLQQRAAAKYHFPLLWTNACCGHPRPGEALGEAAGRRLREELGVSPLLEAGFSFLYAAEDPVSGLSERELDHVLLGRLETAPEPDPLEVAALAWWETSALLGDVGANPERYTPWFRTALPQLAHRGLLSPPTPPAGPG